MIRGLMRATALASALAVPMFCSTVTAQIAVSANDNKIALVNGQNTVPANPAPDTVTIVDIGVSPPKVLGELQAPSSVVGVPQSVAVSKDESVALVTAAMKLDPADPKKIGTWAQGSVWSNDGKAIVVQATHKKELQVFSFDGKEAKQTGSIKTNGSGVGMRTSMQ